MKIQIRLYTILLALSASSLHAQMITGVWKGKINRQKAEIKIVQVGDSLTGTSYYYESPSNYRRYTIKGYLDVETNDVVWWDDQLIEEKAPRVNISSPGRSPLLARADFNCPGDGRMMLDGKAGKLDDEDPNGQLHLDKAEAPLFSDEWDEIIDNYLTGGNDRDRINELASQSRPAESEEPEPAAPLPLPKSAPPPPATIPAPPIALPPAPRPQTVEEKFNSRRKVFAREIPITGDSIELRFYDNAEIDGDSISLFLNDRLIFEHIRLTEKAYTIKLAVKDLQASNELTMVAENLGSIPPNTSYMIVMVGNLRYDAQLQSTEGSSAMVRFVKKE